MKRSEMISQNVHRSGSDAMQEGDIMRNGGCWPHLLFQLRLGVHLHPVAGRNHPRA